jgi:hypothetical protein
LDQNVALITIQIAKSKIKNCNFVNFLSHKKVAWIVLDGALASDEFLERANLRLVSLADFLGWLLIRARCWDRGGVIDWNRGNSLSKWFWSFC